MKRILLLCLTMLLACSMLCYPISAEEYTSPYDARNIPDKVAELLPGYEDADIVYKQYYGSPSHMGIGRIDSYIRSMEVDSIPTYVVVAENVQRWYKVKNGTAVEEASGEISFITKEMLTHEAICAVSPEICIEGVYYFFASSYAVVDVTMLYKTNLGDYVYFKTEQTQPMLMSVRRYDEYLAAWAEYSREMEATKGMLMGGRYVLHIDSSSYDWKSPDFDPDAPLPIEKDERLIVEIGAAVLIAGAVVTAVLIIHQKRKKAALLAEETESTEDAV